MNRRKSKMQEKNLKQKKKMAGQSAIPEKEPISSWEQADFAYSDLYVRLAMPILGSPPRIDQVEEEIDEILTICPDYHPALFHRVKTLYDKGAEEESRSCLDRALTSLLDRPDKGECEETIDDLDTILTQDLRYDLNIFMLERCIKRYPTTAIFYDYLAGALGESDNRRIDEALALQAKALSLAPTNGRFWCNQGWLYLIAGKLEPAEQSLLKAREMIPEDTFVTGNLGVLDSLKRTGGTYRDFLLQPGPDSPTEGQCENESLRECELLPQDLNSRRVSAFKYYLLENSMIEKSRLGVRYNEWVKFMAHAVELEDEQALVYEDLNYFSDMFERIMIQFIMIYRDVDGELFEDVYAMMRLFADFLLGVKLVYREDYDEFVTTIANLKQGLRDKLDRCVLIHANPTLNDRQKKSRLKAVLDP